MKKLFGLVGSLVTLSFNVCNAASVFILDEGINTDQRWRAETVTQRFQICSSLGTVFTRNGVGSPTVFSYLSLCADQNQIQRDEIGASEYKNKKDYIAFGQPNEFDIFANDVNGRKRGIHGNQVSDALYDFDTTVNHRPLQVFGIQIHQASNVRRWRTSYILANEDYDDQPEVPALNIIRALEYISLGTGVSGEGFDQLVDLGAVNISIVYPGSFGQRLCAEKEGQDSVNRLRDKGIAVVAGLNNVDIPINEVTWPACLDSVIAVGGLTTPGIGIGANNMTFFAKDTVSGGISGQVNGNSLAAPRVAAAYALLHESFPSSTLGQKFDALRDANSLRTRSTSVGSVTRPYIAKQNMSKALTELGKVVPLPPLNVPDDSLDYSNLASWGPVFGGSQSTALFTINLPGNGGLASSKTSSPEDVSSRFAKIDEQDLPRDVLIEFTGAVQSSNSSAALRLWVNGYEITEFKGFPISGSAIAQFVINRKYLNTGSNQIEIRPFNAGSSWGVKDISATYLPIIPLQVGITNTNEYGYNSFPRYRTGLRATFSLNSISSGGMEISMNGWDIDTSTETSVLVNGRFVGQLSVTENNSYGIKNSFLVSPAKLRQGLNYIELIQDEPKLGWSGVEDEKWAIKNLFIKALAPQAIINDPTTPVAGSGIAALPAIISLLLDEPL